MAPKMIVIAGPPGSGKSTLYPVSSFEVNHFNADERGAALNGGSFMGISADIRTRVNREFEMFVLEAIRTGVSFAIETTLRGEVTFEQADLAKKAGFVTEMRYLCLRDFSLHLARVKARADAGGHSASERTLRRIYEASLANLPRAIHKFDLVWVYDNTEIRGSHRLLLEVRNGQIHFEAHDLPGWLISALD